MLLPDVNAAGGRSNVRGKLPLPPYLLALAMIANWQRRHPGGHPQNMIIGHLSKIPSSIFRPPWCPWLSRFG